MISALQPDPGFGDTLDRILVDIDQVHVRPIIRLKVECLEGHPTRAEAVVLGDQLLRRHGVMHPLSDLVGDELTKGCIGRAVGVDIAKVAQPLLEPGLRVQILPELQPLRLWHVERPSVVRGVHEARVRLVALSKDLWVPTPDLVHFLGADFCVVERR